VFSMNSKGGKEFVGKLQRSCSLYYVIMSQQAGSKLAVLSLESLLGN
jgi:hypothetical protein